MKDISDLWGNWAVKSTSGKLLTMLRDGGAQSRADLARGICVSASVLTKLAAASISRGLVLEADTTAPSPMGRPPSLLAFNPSGAYVIGANIGYGRISVALVDSALNVQQTASANFDQTKTTVDDMIDLVSKISNRLIEDSQLPRTRIAGVGVGVPGKVDAAKRSNLYSKLERSGQAVPFADRIEQRLALPVVLEHNASAIALAEAIYGAGAGNASVLHIYMRSGLGAGLVHFRNGEANSPGPIEIGHVVVEPHGLTCVCGTRGCLEARFSEPALLSALQLDHVPEEGLIAAARANAEVWALPYEQFVQTLATSITLLGPDLILLGGHLGEAPQEFIDQLKSDLTPRLMRQFEGVRIERAHLVPDAGALGAACVALEKYVFEG
ncbi:ROK family protein [Devosia sp. MC521]|uniref:ROK family protein n=1 Tax=Devosia sp. MC521 TaxID=2759954 RepID=UPI0015FE18EC|nr:ROK family protein [Devosia sp. MC521]MBJ6987858.1 ROK family protein [Devosia sp. MC521]QMW63762.1 ROK family protein [Devosia sp. MC521]